MKILYVTQYFPPETGAGSRRAFEMAAVWRAAGHEVTVVCPFPNYPEGKIAAGYTGKFIVREKLEGIDVVRVPIFAAVNKTFVTRLANYASFALTGALATVFRKTPDIVYVSSPPLPVGMAGLLASFKGARFFFEVRDLWPESARVVGELNNPTVLRAATSFEEWCYNHADRIVVVTEGISSRLTARGIPADKIILAPNGANLERYARENIAPISREAPRFELFYGGLLGLAQGIPGVIKAMQILRDEPSFHLTIAGAGPFAAALADAKERENLKNFTLLGNVPADMIPGLIAKADACLVPLGGDKLFRGALPSKMFEAWACGRPVLLSAAGEAAKLVARTRAGVIVPPADPGALAEAILWMGKHRSTLIEMGERGKVAVASFDRVTIAKNLLRTMEADQ